MPNTDVGTETNLKEEASFHQVLGLGFGMERRSAIETQFALISVENFREFVIHSRSQTFGGFEFGKQSIFKGSCTEQISFCFSLKAA